MVAIIGRIVLIPVVAAVAYEVLRWGAKRREQLGRSAGCSCPGIWLQAITTKQPDDSMIEIAIASMQEALAANGETAPEGSWIRCASRCRTPRLAADVEAAARPAERPARAGWHSRERPRPSTASPTLRG